MQTKVRAGLWLGLYSDGGDVRSHEVYDLEDQRELLTRLLRLRWMLAWDKEEHAGRVSTQPSVKLD